jgi:hypothetical protein
MAVLYVDDGGSDTSPYDTRAKAANLWQTAADDAACVAGSTIFINSNHVEQYAGDTTLASAFGVAGNPVTTISVDFAGTADPNPPVAADIETMMAGGGNLDAKTNGAFDISLFGWDIWIGLEFIMGDDLLITDNDIDVLLINCRISIDDETQIGLSGANDTLTRWENVDFVLNGTGKINILSGFEWVGGTFSFGVGGSVVTNVFDPSSGRGGVLHVSDVDFQDIDAGDFMVDDENSSWDVLIKRCKIPAAANYMDTGPTGGAMKVRFHSVDDGNNIFTFKEYYFEGLTESDTAIYLDATYDGTNGYSAKLTSNANAIEWSRPLRFKLADIWNPTPNATVTVELLINSATDLFDDDFWIEIEYPDSTTGALGGLDQTSRAATILTTPSDVTVGHIVASAKGAGDWTGEGGTAQFYKIAVTLANDQAGVLTVWANLAKPSTVIYVDPKVVLS